MQRLKTTLIKNILAIIPAGLRNFLRGVRPPFEIEIHLAEHCNLNCISCLHYSSIASHEFPDIKNLINSFKELGRHPNCFATIRLLGGEPLLNPNLPEILFLARKYLGNAKIELLTNGILLLNEKVITDEFWQSCKKNYIIIAVTKYPIGMDYNSIKQICKKKGCKYVIFGDRIGDENFCAYKLKIDPYKKNFKKYIGCCNRRCLQLVNDKIFPCSVSAYVRHINNKFNQNFTHKEGDFLLLKNISLYNLIKFQSKSKPFCSHCTPRSDGFPWRRSNYKASEWINQ